MGASNRQQCPRFIRRCKYRFTMVKRDDLVVAAVNHEYRTPDFPNVVTRRVTKAG